MERILLVEDDAQITASLSAFLQSEGFSVETATGETRARQLVEQTAPGLLLVDAVGGGQRLRRVRLRPEPGSAGDLPHRLRRREQRGAGAGHGGRRLHCQALSAQRAGLPHPQACCGGTARRRRWCRWAV